jgi:S-adenosylmethionine:tRNA-ribosyltransferase-isomerase (queuine synthetase)
MLKSRCKGRDISKILNSIYLLTALNNTKICRFKLGCEYIMQKHTIVEMLLHTTKKKKKVIQFVVLSEKIKI